MTISRASYRGLVFTFGSSLLLLSGCGSTTSALTVSAVYCACTHTPKSLLRSDARIMTARADHRFGLPGSKMRVAGACVNASFPGSGLTDVKALGLQGTLTQGGSWVPTRTWMAIQERSRPPPVSE